MNRFLHSPARQHGDCHSGRGARLRWALRQLGTEPIVLLGFLVELGWAFVGSLGYGLRLNGPGGPLQAAVWVGGAVAIALVTAAAVHLAAPERRKRD